MTPPRNPPVYYNNSSYSQPSLMTREGPMSNPANVANPNNPGAYLPDLHSHSVQSKYSHVIHQMRRIIIKENNFLSMLDRFLSLAQ